MISTTCKPSPSNLWICPNILYLKKPVLYVKKVKHVTNLLQGCKQILPIVILKISGSPESLQPQSSTNKLFDKLCKFVILSLSEQKQAKA